jgi:Polyketide cyclase / dehydrase and lipid transport
VRQPVAVTTDLEVKTTIDTAFEVIVPIDLTKIFTGFGMLPAVTGTHSQTGAWDHVGASRTVQLSDGSEACEQLTAYRAPSHFAYRIDRFTGPLRLLVSHAEGAWWFTEGRGGTRISWNYSFHPLAGRRVLVAILVAPIWRLYQRRALAAAAAAAERVMPSPERPIAG